MLNIYTSYKCRTCKKEFVVLTEDVNKNRYLVCPHCSSQRVDKEKANDSLKECMKERSYRKMHGVIKQVR